MKKVLILANEWTTIVHFRMEILQALREAGCAVTVALPLCDEAQPIRDLGCELVHLDVSRHGVNPVEELKVFLECRAIIQAEKPDAVITYTVKPNIYGSLSCWKKNIPYVNNITGLGSVLQNQSPVAWIMLRMMKLAFRRTRCVFFQNRDNYQRFCSEGVITEKTPVAFLPGSGVDLNRFSFVPYPQNQPLKFVIVSRLQQDKGYAEFFAAAEEVKARHPELEFHVIGWSEDENLRAKAEELQSRGLLVYHGALPQEEVHAVVASCSCLVHPSYHEGMANVILEAAATGRPVIASDINGCKEAVEDGQTGFLCEVKNTQALVQAMEKFIALDEASRGRMGIAGRKKMEAEFDRQIVVRTVLDKLQSI